MKKLDSAFSVDKTKQIACLGYKPELGIRHNLQKSLVFYLHFVSQRKLKVLAVKKKDQIIKGLNIYQKKLFFIQANFVAIVSRSFQ